MGASGAADPGGQIGRSAARSVSSTLEGLTIFRKFQREGVWEGIWEEFHMAAREALDREASPAAAIIELKKFADRVHAAAALLAGASDEPAQTIVDAAAGECGNERMALANAMERNGFTKPYDLIDDMAKEMRPGLLALVLNARASAARPTEQPARTQAARGQAL